MSACTYLHVTYIYIKLLDLCFILYIYTILYLYIDFYICIYKMYIYVCVCEYIYIYGKYHTLMKGKKWIIYRNGEIFYIHDQGDSNLSGCKFFPNWSIDSVQFQLKSQQVILWILTNQF